MAGDVARLSAELIESLTSQRSSSASGSADGSGLAVVTLPDPRFGGEPSRLFVRCYGDAEAAARRLVEQLQVWDAAGRPPALPRRIRIYPSPATVACGPDVLLRRESVLVVE